MDDVSAPLLSAGIGLGDDASRVLFRATLVSTSMERFGLAVT